MLLQRSLAQHVRDGAVGHQLIQKLKAAIVTGGVDDKSFNQSAWKVCKTGVKNTIFLKIKVTLTSNHQ